MINCICCTDTITVTNRILKKELFGWHAGVCLWEDFMTSEEKEFLFYAVMGYDYLKRMKHLSGDTLASLCKKAFPTINYEIYRSKIKNIRSLANKYKQEFGGKEAFCKWYVEQYDKQHGRCAYCGVSEAKCRHFFEQQRPDALVGSKRVRGFHLELEHKKANLHGHKENCVLACYVCNNAKSDFLSEEDFKTIAAGISAFWEKK